MENPAEFVEALVLRLHRRNGGHLTALDASLPTLAPELLIDSLDLAEIMVAIEKEYGVSPFEAPEPPRNWAGIIASLPGASQATGG